MPLVQESHDPAGDGQRADDAQILGPDGGLTLEAQATADFLDKVDFDDLFDDPDVAEFVEEEAVYVKPDPENPGRMIPCDEDDPDADDVLIVESLPGEVAALFLDEDDLSQMFDYYLTEEVSEAGLEGRLAAGLLLDEAKTPFKKGDFRKGPMKGVSGKSSGAGRQAHNQRVRMMYAMLKKGAIKRVGKGKGYKGGGYTKGTSYKGGTSGPDASKYNAMRSTLHKRAGAIKKLPVDPGRRKVVGVIYKNLGGKMPKNWVPPEKRFKVSKGAKPAGKGGAAAAKLKLTPRAKVKGGDKKVAAKAASKAAFGGKAAKKGKGINAGANVPAANLSESALLVGMVHTMSGRNLLSEQYGGAARPEGDETPANGHGTRAVTASLLR